MFILLPLRLLVCWSEAVNPLRSARVDHGRLRDLPLGQISLHRHWFRLAPCPATTVHANDDRFDQAAFKQAAVRLALPEGKLDCQTLSAKRFFHGNSKVRTNARGFPIKSCRAATAMPAIRPKPAIVSSCPGPNSNTAMPVGTIRSGSRGTNCRNAANPSDPPSSAPRGS